MQRQLIDITLVALIAVYVVDVSGFTESWRSALARLLHVKVLRSLPPFDCGTCMAFWAVLATALIEGLPLLQGAALACAASLLSLPLGQLMIFIREGLTALVGKLFDLWQK